MKHIDALAVGETMIGFISATEFPWLSDARIFILYPGGEIASVASVTLQVNNHERWRA